jgi:cytochrome d ubiquinol oxidase subunit I
MFILIAAAGSLLLWRKRAYASRAFLWVLMLSFPFPFIANSAGWITAELGRQPWLVYGLLRTPAGTSATVSAGNTLFTLLGFLGLYFVVGVLFLFLVMKAVGTGPGHASNHERD